MARKRLQADTEAAADPDTPTPAWVRRRITKTIRALKTSGRSVREIMKIEDLGQSRIQLFMWVLQREGTVAKVPTGHGTWLWTSIEYSPTLISDLADDKAERRQIAAALRNRLTAEAEEMEDLRWPVRAYTSAADSKTPQGLGPRSVFEIAAPGGPL